jgi:hypothetical protein
MTARAVSKDVLSVRRWSAEGERLLLVNFGDASFETGEFGGGWRRLLAHEGTTTDARGVSVPPRAAAILARGA